MNCLTSYKLGVPLEPLDLSVGTETRDKDLPFPGNEDSLGRFTCTLGIGLVSIVVAGVLQDTNRLPPGLVVGILE